MRAPSPRRCSSRSGTITRSPTTGTPGGWATPVETALHGQGVDTLAAALGRPSWSTCRSTGAGSTGRCRTARWSTSSRWTCAYRGPNTTNLATSGAETVILGDDQLARRRSRSSRALWKVVASDNDPGGGRQPGGHRQPRARFAGRAQLEFAPGCRTSKLGAQRRVDSGCPTPPLLGEGGDRTSTRSGSSSPAAARPPSAERWTRPSPQGLLASRRPSKPTTERWPAVRGGVDGDSGVMTVRGTSPGGCSPARP